VAHDKAEHVEGVKALGRYTTELQVYGEDFGKEIRVVGTATA
jgi:hypothetical protein